MGLCDIGKIKLWKIHGWNRHDDTNTLRPSRTIYVNPRPNRYYSLSFFVGVKNPHYLFAFLQVQRRGWRRGVPWLVRSKIWRAFCCFQHMRCFSYIIFIAYYNYKSRRLAQWIMRCLATIGTWVRFPGPPNICFIFFIMYSYAGSPMCSTINLTNQRAMCPHAPIQWLWSADYDVPQSSNVQTIPEVKRGFVLNGLQIAFVTSKRAHHPLVLS